MPHPYRSVVLAGAVAISSSALAQTAAEKKWCPPTGPAIERNLPTLLSEGQQPYFKPGWAVIAMHVKPGAQPVSDVRVLSESGSDALARTWLPLVRQWVGCAENERETIYQVKFTYGIMGIPTFPTKEAFSIRAFREPRGKPQLPQGDWGVGICPIRATLTLRQPTSANVVSELEGSNRPEVRAWLENLVPDLEYMRPNKDGNRVEFECRVSESKVTFFAR